MPGSAVNSARFRVWSPQIGLVRASRCYRGVPSDRHRRWRRGCPRKARNRTLPAMSRRS